MEIFFSLPPADSNWYRAIVLEVGDNELSVIYADYGNTEKVPYSRVMPITNHLLQLPFQITRCTLTGKTSSLFCSLKCVTSSHVDPSSVFPGKEHFPTEWTKESQQMFRDLLVNGVLATVQSFDGSTNMLSLTLPTERGGGNITAMILDAIQAQAKSNSQPSTTKADQTDLSSGAPVSDCPQTKENTNTNTTPEPTPGINLQKKNSPAESVSANNGWSIIDFISVTLPSNIIQAHRFNNSADNNTAWAKR